MNDEGQRSGVISMTFLQFQSDPECLEDELVGSVQMPTFITYKKQLQGLGFNAGLHSIRKDNAYMSLD